MRAELGPADRASFTARRKAIYETLHPETKMGAAPGKAGGGKVSREDRQLGDDGADRFTADTAAKTGKSERAVQRDVHRGEKVCQQVEAMDHCSYSVTE